MSEEQYISMSVSRDSDEGPMGGNMVLDLCNVSNGCFGSPTLRDDDLFPISSDNHGVTTNPATTNIIVNDGSAVASMTKSPGNTKNHDLSEALMGDDAFQQIRDQALYGLPSTRGLLSRLRTLNLREKLEVTMWNRRFWPVLPLFVKAEMNAPLTVVEEITTWIVVICWLQVVVLSNGVSLIVGGVALFTALTILHYWYGFTRYHSLESDWYNDVMFGKALDENFELIRDICSYQCHGDGERRKQIGAILLTAPFSLVNHLAYAPFYILSQIYQLICGSGCSNNGQDAPAPTVPLMLGAFVANVLLTTVWLFGGPILQTLSVLTFLVNQRLYNALLFRRSFEGFVTSFVFGSFCVGETTDAIESPVQEEVVDDSNRDVIEDPNALKKKRSWTAKVKKIARTITEKTKARLAARRKNRMNRTNSKQASVHRATTDDEEDIEMGRMASDMTIQRNDSLFDGLEDAPVRETTTTAMAVAEGGMTSEVAFVPLVDEIPITASPDVSNPYALLPSKKDTPSKRNGIKLVAQKAMNPNTYTDPDKNHPEDESLEELPFDVVQKGRFDKSLKFLTTRISVITASAPVVDTTQGAPVKTTEVKPKAPPPPPSKKDRVTNSAPIVSESTPGKDNKNEPSTISAAVEQSTEQQQGSKNPQSEKLNLSKKIFGPKVQITKVTAKDEHAEEVQEKKQEKEPVEESVEIADVVNFKSYLRKATKEPRDQEKKQEKESVDESVEIADVINVKSYLRKVAKEQRIRSRSLSFNHKRRVGVLDVDPSSKDDAHKDRATLDDMALPVEKSTDYSKMMSIKAIAQRIAKKDSTKKHAPNQTTTPAEPVDESIEVSENVILKQDKPSKLKDIKKLSGGALLGRVFKRSGAESESLETKKTAIQGVLSSDDDDKAKETREGGASAEFQKETETARDDSQLSPKRAMDTIGGILQSSDSVSEPSKISHKSNKSRNHSSNDESVADNQSLSTTDSASYDEYYDDDYESMQVTDALDFLGEMLCMDPPKRHKAPLITGAHGDDGNSVSGSTLDSRDLQPTDVLSADGSREGEPEEEGEEADIIASTLKEAETSAPILPLATDPKSKKKRGIKKFLPRINKNPIKVEKLDEKSKNDPELVKKWIIDQTKALRTRSKVLNSVWNRAIKLRQKKEEQKNKMDEANANLATELEAMITSENEETPAVVEPVTKRKFHVVFDAKTLEQEETKRKQQELAKKQELARKEEEAANEAKAAAAGESFYDQLMLIWYNDYVKEAPTEEVKPELKHELQHINALADDISASDGSTLSSMASLMNQVPPKNLIEFVEQKIEQDILLSRFCVGDSVHSGMQCDAGFGYLTDKDSPGFFAELCGVKA